MGATGEISRVATGSSAHKPARGKAGKAREKSEWCVVARKGATT